MRTDVRQPDAPRRRSPGGAHDSFRARFRRRRLFLGHRITEPMGPFVQRLIGTPLAARLIPRLPSLPAYLRRRYEPHKGPWRAYEREIPHELKTVPGAWRDPAGEEEANREAPLHDWVKGNATAVEWMFEHMWRPTLPTAPRTSRAKAKLSATNRRPPDPVPVGGAGTAELTAELKEFAASIGISALGVAEYEEKYQFVEHRDKVVGDRMIVCILEQNYDATQTIPSPVSEQAAFATYAELLGLDAQIVSFLKDRGHRAIAHASDGQGVVIAYGVAAGLGQLGINGQLLTPQAGSRCRVFTISTDAPLVLDEPVDYGMHKICDSCKACVRRCPVNAIPGKRQWRRGVLKAKIVTERCAPIVAQASGCGICMKVCPVQKYGLKALVEEFDRTGRVLGRGTDELEGFDWPLDGHHYGPGELPPIPDELVGPEGVTILAYPTEVDPSYSMQFH